MHSNKVHSRKTFTGFILSILSVYLFTVYLLTSGMIVVVESLTPVYFFLRKLPSW